MRILKDEKGQQWEIKTEGSSKKAKHSRIGEGEDKWKDGPPPVSRSPAPAFQIFLNGEKIKGNEKGNISAD